MALTGLPAPGLFGTEVTRLSGYVKNAACTPLSVDGRSGVRPWIGWYAGKATPPPGNAEGALPPPQAVSVPRARAPSRRVLRSTGFSMVIFDLQSWWAV